MKTDLRFWIWKQSMNAEIEAHRGIRNNLFLQVCSLVHNVPTINFLCHSFPSGLRLFLISIAFQNVTILYVLDYHVHLNTYFWRGSNCWSSRGHALWIFERWKFMYPLFHICGHQTNAPGLLLWNQHSKTAEEI